jgi:hypothetical protein
MTEPADPQSPTPPADFNWGDFWPVILIAVGAIVIFQGMRRRTG